MPYASQAPGYLPPPRAVGAEDSVGAADECGNGDGVLAGVAGGCGAVVVAAAAAVFP